MSRIFTPEAIAEIQAIAAEVLAAAPRSADPSLQLVTVKRASQQLDIPENTLRKWIQQGRIKKHTIQGCIRLKLSEIVELD